jgi:hypothetical protein
VIAFRPADRADQYNLFGSWVGQFDVPEDRAGWSALEETEEQKIDVESVPCFALLLEAVFTPLLIKARLESLPPLERDEGLDALAERAVKWRWLMLGWATETGRAGSLASTDGEVTFDQIAFLKCLAEVAQFVDLEWNTPVQQRTLSGAATTTVLEGAAEVGQDRKRLAIMGRTAWNSIALSTRADVDDMVDVDDVTPEELDEALAVTDTEQLPIFGEPARVTEDGQRIGDAWLRIAPHSVEYLERNLSTTFATLALLEEQRLSSVRDLLHEQDEVISPERLAAINRDFSVRGTIVKALRTVSARLKAEKDQRKRAALEKNILADFRLLEPPKRPELGNVPDTVRRGIDAITDDAFATEIAARVAPPDKTPRDYGAALDLIDRYRASKATTPPRKPLDDLYRYLRRRTLDRGVVDWLRAWSGNGVIFVILIAILLLLLELTNVRDAVHALIRLWFG